MIKFGSLDQALIGLSKKLLNEGVIRKTRGFDCVEIPEPVLICIENPCNRYVTIERRKWNKFLPWIESLWLALGFNSLDVLPGKYVKSLYNFSDDGETWRAGYGPRIRYYSGHDTDYNIGSKDHSRVYSGSIVFIDQLEFVIETLKRDIGSRQALITIHDPAKDDFDKFGELKVTKDQPCTRSIQFMVVDGKLDCTVHMRSNDLVWGFSAVNVFNFTLMQEYVANILGVPVGKYYHFANNLHYYKNFEDDIRYYAFLDERELPNPKPFYYKDALLSLKDFDCFLDTLLTFEQKISSGERNLSTDLGNDLINDWAMVMKLYWTKDPQKFINPILNSVFNG